MAEACNMGHCLLRQTVRENYIYEDKVFPTEDAAMLMRDTWAQTQILAHQNLDGEVGTGGDDQGVFVTFHEDVKPGDRKRIYRDRIVSGGWYSKANGYSDLQCGFIGGSTRRQIEIDTYLCTSSVRQEEDICMNEFLGTWKMSMLARGMHNQMEEIFISDDVFYAFERANYESIDKHFWHGDYKSSDASIMHTDGIIKQLVRARDNDKAPMYEFTFTGLDDTNCIEGAVGAAEFSIQWDTDVETTLQAFAAQLATYMDYKGERQFPTVAVAANVMTVTGQTGEVLDLQFVITNFANGACSGFSRCSDGTIEVNEEVANGATVMFNELQAAEGGNAPIAIGLETIKASNVLDKLEELYNAIQQSKAEILEPQFGGTLFVAPNVWAALRIALLKETSTFLGSQGQLATIEDLYGFSRIVKANYLCSDYMLYFRPQDVHVATDLINDVSEIRTGFDRKCETAWFKNRFAIGFLVSEPGNVAGTLCIPDTFGPNIPCEVDQA